MRENHRCEREILISMNISLIDYLLVFGIMPYQLIHNGWGCLLKFKLIEVKFKIHVIFLLGTYHMLLSLMCLVTVE